MPDACLGPFKYVDAWGNVLIVEAPDKALVPKSELRLRLDNVKAILEANGGYYVIYNTDNIEEYRPYLGKVPREARRISEITLPACPRCGSTMVRIIDDDELYCHVCRRPVPWSTRIVWRDSGVSLDNVVQGSGIYILDAFIDDGNYIREVSRISEYDTVYGNVNVHVIEFYGYENDPPSERWFMVYRRVLAFGRQYVQRVRSLNDGERAMIGGIIAGWNNDYKYHILARLASEFDDKGRALEVILRYKVYEHEPWPLLKGISDDVLRPLRIRVVLDALRRDFEAGNEAGVMGWLHELEALDYEDDYVRMVRRTLEEEVEERIRVVREREEALKEKVKPIIEDVKKRFVDLPVDFEEHYYVDKVVLVVRLRERVSRRVFQKFYTTVKALGMRYEVKGGYWYKEITPG